uniref:Odorant receptors OR2.2 n=1 Tax=Lobesia botrana TaxID=209534 RepID=A0A345BET4_9NEOP|nr:odorant receptors OR2.2 [Lobesia botrana]
MCMFLAFLVMHRLVVARSDNYHEMVRDYLFDFHLFYYKDRSKYSAKVYATVHVVSGVLTFYVQCQMVIGMFLFNLKPLFNNYSRGLFGDRPAPNATFEQAVYYYSPGDFAYTTKEGGVLLFVGNIPLTGFITLGICVFDLLVSTITLQILGHLEILKHSLLTMPLPKDVKRGMYSIEENVQIRQLLKEIIQHHGVIVKFVDKCTEALSDYMFCFYFIMQLITCILLLELSAVTWDALARYGPLNIVVFQQLIQLSVLFELINSKSVHLIDAVYFVPWESMNTSNRRTALLLLHRVQTPLSLKAGKMVPVGVNTMAAILKTTFSYYMMLTTVASER